MTELAVLVPVLGRPHRVEPVLDAFLSTCDCVVHFIADRGDQPEIHAIKRDGRGRLLVHDGGYAQKINYAVEVTKQPLLFLGADDLEPQPGWLEAAVMCAARDTERRPHLAVVGVNDMLRRDREHATHFLMTRSYAELPTVDGQPGPCCTEYRHWYIDDELIATARARGVYAYAADAHVRHLHYLVGAAPDDDTYARGREFARIDARTFRGREHLWALT